jgi:hypothetical protein
MRTLPLLLTLVLALLVVAAGLVPASGPARPREVLSSGASVSTGPGTSLQATLGQPLVTTISGGAALLGQGFWHGGVPAGFYIYLPLVTREG